MRKLASIQKIKSLSPIPNCDNIEKAEILGWELVVKKGDFNVGDLCVYCEVDCILPNLECFAFLQNVKMRIKTRKIRNQISQGIAFPLSIINQVDPIFNINSLKLDDDVTDLLLIKKYDPEAVLDIIPEEEISSKKKSWISRRFNQFKYWLLNTKPRRSGADFPIDIPKTDEIRVQVMESFLSRNEGEVCYISEKLEGTSATFIVRKKGNWLAKFLKQDSSFQICSRNRVIVNSDSSNFISLQYNTHHIVKAGLRYDIINKMKKLGKSFAIQAEVIGPKIQKNYYNIPDFDLRIFLMYDIDNKKYFSLQEMQFISEYLGLPLVPILETQHSLKSDIKYYIELSKGNSQLNDFGTKLREGIVVRSVVDGRKSFKSINPEYLLKQN